MASPEAPAGASSSLYGEQLYTHPYEQDMADAQAKAIEDHFRSILAIEAQVDSPAGITDLTEKLRDPDLEVRAHAERSLTSLSYDMQNPNTRDKDRPNPEFYPVATLAFDNLSPERYRFSRDALAPTELNEILGKIKAGLDSPDGLEYLPLSPDQYVIAHELLEKASYVALEDEHKKVDHTLRLEAIWGDKKLLESEDAQKVYLGLVNKAFEEFTIKETGANINGETKADDAAGLRTLIEAKDPGIFKRVKLDGPFPDAELTTLAEQIRNTENSDPETAHIISTDVPPEETQKISLVPKIPEGLFGDTEPFGERDLDPGKLQVIAKRVRESAEDNLDGGHMENRPIRVPGPREIKEHNLVLKYEEIIVSLLDDLLAIDSRKNKIKVKETWGDRSFPGKTPEELVKIKEDLLQRLEFTYKDLYKKKGIFTLAA